MQTVQRATHSRMSFQFSSEFGRHPMCDWRACNLYHHFFLTRHQSCGVYNHGTSRAICSFFASSTCAQRSMDRIRERARMSRQRDNTKVYFSLLKYPQTMKELSRSLRIEINSMTWRIYDLRKDKLIERVGQKGRFAIWGAV